jgi:hypothetical protein
MNPLPMGEGLGEVEMWLFFPISFVREEILG